MGRHIRYGFIFIVLCSLLVACGGGGNTSNSQLEDPNPGIPNLMNGALKIPYNAVGLEFDRVSCKQLIY